MVESRYYRVADLVFSIKADATHFALMDNYAPFATEPTEDCLFALTVGDVPDAPDAELFFTDTSDDDMPRIELYRMRTTHEWLLMVAPTKAAAVCARLQTSADFREAVLQIDGDNARFAIDNAAMLLYAFTTATRGVLEMHASVTVKDGRGFLFLGHSGTGKSTHSRLWHEAYPEAWLLNDDNPVLRLLDDGEVRVYGSPWSGKTPCYRQESVPVGGIVPLKQAPENKIRPMRLPEAYANMLCSCSGLKIIPEMMDGLYATISRIIQTVPVYQLECLPDTDAARLCHDTLNK